MQRNILSPLILFLLILFYKFSNSQTNYYVADLTEEQTSVINISIESWRRAEFLNIAFFEH